MASKTEIANLAISHIGTGKAISNLDTERSAEANVCRLFYETSKEAVLGDHHWPFSRKEAVLNLVEETPEGEWSFIYRYPSDCVDMRRIKSGVRNDTLKSRIPFEISSDDSGKTIITDKEDAECEYTKNVNNSTLFSAEFVLALSFRLAAYIIPRLSGGDPFKAKAEMLAQYELELGRAKKKSMNEERTEQPPPTELIGTRS